MTTVKTSNSPPVLKLAVPSPLRRHFDYLPPPLSQPEDWGKLKPGIRLKVPFGSRTVTAVLVRLSNTSELSRNKLKQAIEVLDDAPLFSQALMNTFNWAAAYYQHPPGEVYSAVLPKQLRQGGEAQLKPTWEWQCRESGNSDSAKMLNRAPQQKALLQFIQSRQSVTSKECTEAGFASRLLLELERKELIRKSPVASSMFSPSIETKIRKPNYSPNAGQMIAIKAITKSLAGYQCYLLDGITGSGKTEVYMQAISKVLEQNRQALILVPEIGLTPQTIRMFEQRFDCKVVTMHSGMSSGERLESWLLAKSGAAPIVIGTRSAVFTPLARPGIIIIDEEHDASFKQQDGFKYSARDLAIMRAKQEKINIVLGSATPALESLYNAQNGRYTHLILSQRAGNAVKPTISLMELSHNDSASGFSSDLIQSIQGHLDKQHQVLIFINRRGFAPSLHCTECGFNFECPRCDAQLTVHKQPPMLQCHHCETRQSIPDNCPQCQSRKLATRGIGTEKTEQLLQQRFNEFPVIRIDRDSTRNRNQLDALLGKIQEGEPCLLVGTQMLAKGHHFPKVTLVAVLDADNGLFSPDFRGQESMVQLLFQVAGRSGREDLPGQVIIQTRHATHVALQSLIQNNYNEIAQRILAERELANMPPYSFLTLFKAEATDIGSPLNFLNKVSQLCEEARRKADLSNIKIHRPLPAPMEKRAGRYRAHLLIQAQSRSELQLLLRQVCPALESLKSARKTRWSVDVDPQDLI